MDSLRRMRDAGPTRLLFGHLGLVTDVELVFDQSKEELQYWVEQVSIASHASMDHQHAIAMVKEKDMQRHPDVNSDAERATEFEELSSTDAGWRNPTQTPAGHNNQEAGGGTA
jgi:hypothetical protein